MRSHLQSACALTQIPVRLSQTYTALSTNCLNMSWWPSMSKQLREFYKAMLVSKGSLQINLKGRCMEPFLVSGDKAFIQASSEINIGDICLISSSDGSLTVHRILGKNNSIAFAKGDFSGRGELISTQSILGIVSAFQLGRSKEWSEYRPSPRFKENIAALSLQLCSPSRTFKKERKEAREELWKVLSSERQKLLSKEALS